MLISVRFIFPSIFIVPIVLCSLNLISCFLISLGRRKRRRILRRKWLPVSDAPPQTPPLKKKDPVLCPALATTPKQSADLWKDKEKWFESFYIYYWVCLYWTSTSLSLYICVSVHSTIHRKRFQWIVYFRKLIESWRRQARLIKKK